MYLIVVGAGKVAASLIEIARDRGYRVALIEKNGDRAREILQKHDVEVYHADIARGGILEEAGVKRADAIVATTGDDSTNLMAMVLGKEYGVETLIAMVDESQHQAMFEHLGVRVLAKPEKIVANALLDFLEPGEDGA
ncbi:MAG: NAD-binding protein [Cyanobacteriota bacterium]|nr:NAD-binding protein [Cyanobacteriota bacterium]